MKFILFVLAALVITGCGSKHSTAPVFEDPKDGYVGIDARLERVGNLAKAAAIDLKIIKFVLSSSLGDTLKDSVSASGSEQIIISKMFRVKSQRSWSINVKSYDSNDSLIHSGTSANVIIKPADTVKIALSTNSRFSMYQANFLSIPDSVSLSEGNGGHSKYQVSINRLILKIGGKIRVDSVDTFNPGQSVSLKFDYITAGTQTVILEAYGSAAGYQGLLFSGNVVFNNAAGTDETKNINMDWKGPGNQLNGIMITLGRVGKNMVNGNMEFTQAE